MELKFQELSIKKIQAPHFIMSPIELKDTIDFEVKRVYFISEATGPSSEHCHKEEKELFVLQKGTCTAIIDSGEGKKEILLSGPTSALYVGNYVWHGFKDFSGDAVLMALSSTNYVSDRSDYIEDYGEWQKVIRSS